MNLTCGYCGKEISFEVSSLAEIGEWWVHLPCGAYAVNFTYGDPTYGAEKLAAGWAMLYSMACYMEKIDGTERFAVEVAD